MIDINNELLNIDCRQGFKMLEDESINLIVTDPPYRIRTYGNRGGMGGLFASDESKLGKIFEYNDIDIKEWINECYRVLKDNSNIYIMVNDYNLYHYMTNVIKAGFKITRLLVWDKCNKICGSFYMAQHEYIIYARKGKAKIINNCSTPSILTVPNKKTKDVDGKNMHDTEKPVQLMEILIANSSNKGDKVLDPFFGYGSTIISCLNLERNYIGFEIDSKYYNKTVERIANHNKQLQLII